MEEKTPSPFKRDIDRACKRLQLASMVLRNVRDAYAAGDRKEAYQNAFEFAYHTERLTLLARTLPALTGIPAARSKMEHQIAEVLPCILGIRRMAGSAWICLRFCQRRSMAERITSARTYTSPWANTSKAAIS